MNYDEALVAQNQIRNANDRGRIGLIQKFLNVRRSLEQILADIVSLTQKAENNAENSNDQPPLPPMPEADKI